MGRKLKEDILFGVEIAGKEGIFRGINADKDFMEYGDIFYLSILARQNAFQPILHVDDTFLAQPTYHDLERQVVDSFKDLKAQEKQSDHTFAIF